MYPQTPNPQPLYGLDSIVMIKYTLSQKSFAFASPLATYLNEQHI